MIDLIWLDIVYEVGKLARIRKVTIVKVHPRFGLVGINIDVVYSLGIESARPADQAMNFVTLAKEEFHKIRAVLPTYASY